METRSLIKDVENNVLSLDKAIEKAKNKLDFINIYIKRNPHQNNEIFLPFYNDLNIDSKVNLFKYNKIFIDNSIFHRKIIDEYINEIVDFSEVIITRTIDVCYLKNMLAFNFNNYEIYSEEFDGYNFKNILLFFKNYKIEENDYELFIAGINKRLNEIKKVYLDRGCEVSNIFILNENLLHEDIDKEEKYQISDLNTCIQNKCIEKSKLDPAFEDNIKQNKKFKPYAFQECTQVIEKNKNKEHVMIALKMIPDLLQKSTKRMIQRDSPKLLELIISYWDEQMQKLDNYKIEIISSLFQYNYYHTSEYLMKEFFKNNSSLQTKFLIIESFKSACRKINLLNTIQLFDLFIREFNNTDIIFTDKKLKIQISIFILSVIQRAEASQRIQKEAALFLNTLNI